MSSIPTWLAIATYNRLDGSYIQGDCDVTGNVIVRGANSLWIDTNTSIKLNGGTVVTLSRDELSYLDGVTSAIQTQINSKATTGDVTTLQTKTQNITSATATLTTIEDNVTLSTGNLVLTAGDLTIASTKSIICDGELKLGTTGKISGTGLTISNAQLAYLNGLTASVETRLASSVQKLTPITYNSTFNTSDFTSDIYLNGIGATQVRTISSDSNTIQFDDTYGFINFLNKIHMYSEFQLDYAGTTYYVGFSLADLYSKNDTINNNRILGITYNSSLDQTEIDHNLTLTGGVGGITCNFLLCDNLSGTSIVGLKSNSTTGTGNFIITSTSTAGSYSTKQLAGDASLLASKPIVFCVNPGSTQATALRLTETQLQLNCDILTNGLVISPAELGYLDGTTGNINTSISNLNTKTANMTASGTVTTYTGTHTFNSAMNLSTGRIFDMNGTGKIRLNSTTSSIELGTSLGILTTGTIYINATELSMLDGASYNLPTRITANTNYISTINTTLTNYSYTEIPTPQTTIAGVVNFTGTTKTTGVTWADGPIKLKSTFVAPVTGELGFTVTALLNGGVISVTTNVVRSILNISLGIGVWIITYNCFLVYGSGTTTTSLRIGLNTTSATTTPSIAISTEANGSYSSSKNYHMMQIVNVSTATTYYLSLYSLFSVSSLSVDGGNVNTTELKAIRIA